jgi:hypothetical protein
MPPSALSSCLQSGLLPIAALGQAKRTTQLERQRTRVFDARSRLQLSPQEGLNTQQQLSSWRSTITERGAIEEEYLFA